MAAALDADLVILPEICEEPTITDVYWRERNWLQADRNGLLERWCELREWLASAGRPRHEGCPRALLEPRFDLAPTGLASLRLEAPRAAGRRRC